MDSNLVDDFSMTLIHQAEDDCAAHDPGMVSAAAMVLVGDVYALLVSRTGSPLYPIAAVPTQRREDGVSPFIR